MRKQFLKTAFIALAGVGLLAGSAFADQIEGGLSMSGSWTPFVEFGDVVSIPNAIGIDFGASYPGGAENTFGVTTTTGDFTVLVTGNPIIGTIQDFEFDSFAPIDPFWEVGGFEFVMTSWTYKVRQEENNSDYLDVYGSGIVSGNNFDPTPGVWNFTGEGANQANFGWSASVATAPVPEPATMLLFGTGLMGLAAVGRRRKVNRA